MTEIHDIAGLFCFAENRPEGHGAAEGGNASRGAIPPSTSGARSAASLFCCHALQTAQRAPNFALCSVPYHTLSSWQLWRKTRLSRCHCCLPYFCPLPGPVCSPPPVILAPVFACGSLSKYVKSESGTVDTPRDIHARVYAREDGGKAQIWLARPAMRMHFLSSCFLPCRSPDRGGPPRGFHGG